MDARILAALFAYGEPTTRDELSRLLGVSNDELSAALPTLIEKITPLGLTIIDDGKRLELRTGESVSDLAETIRKEAFTKDIGKAGIETLSIILYRGPATRAEVDFIRGVNSAHILRSLSMRGLVKRIPHHKDERSFMYEPTTELLAHLGVSRVEDIPDFASVRATIQTLEKGEERPVTEETA